MTSEWLRDAPTVVGAAGIAFLLANRVLSNSALVTDASSAQSRADVLVRPTCMSAFVQLTTECRRQSQLLSALPTILQVIAMCASAILTVRAHSYIPCKAWGAPARSAELRPTCAPSPAGPLLALSQAEGDRVRAAKRRKMLLSQPAASPASCRGAEMGAAAQPQTIASVMAGRMLWLAQCGVCRGRPNDLEPAPRN